MGVTHDDEDTSEKTFANTRKKNPKDDDIPATEQDDEDAKKVNRVATRRRARSTKQRNNEWNDNQKIRFFSDRLKGEAFEWHENYAEEEGDDLNYQDWKEALITRFQGT
ncbi:hypothetical protein OUZ56_012261 [Daphnia magna]|uniref:Ty3 transposon capsid-like protein domain-containing protein n=1 Tax=Daphnia magna TaxID=35525 RepID=A0ABQ9Z2S2_9CRUS|nr:hypothetical protein OUZ56_012261 [Daphnia magna]